MRKAEFFWIRNTGHMPRTETRVAAGSEHWHVRQRDRRIQWRQTVKMRADDPTSTWWRVLVQNCNRKIVSITVKVDANIVASDDASAFLQLVIWVVIKNKSMKKQKLLSPFWWQHPKKGDQIPPGPVRRAGACRSQRRLDCVCGTVWQCVRPGISSVQAYWYR